MATLKQVFKISSFVGILNLSVSVANTATEVNSAATPEGVQVELPVDLIEVQAVLDEGTQVELSEDQVKEMLPWAQNSKVFLEDLLKRVKKLPLSDKLTKTISGIKNTVLLSAPKNTELLMRYVLNRAVKVVEVIDEQIGTEKNTSTLNVQFNILKESIELAMKYYKSDLSFLTNQVDSEELVSFSRFGINYSQFLYEYTKLVVDASAQYQLMRMALGFLQWDLYRDQDNKHYAPIIMTINVELSDNPKDLNTSDQEYLEKVRNMKLTYEQQEEKTFDLVKKLYSQEEFIDYVGLASLKKKSNSYTVRNPIRMDSDLELRCNPGSHVVSIFGKHLNTYNYKYMNSLGIYCSDGSQVDAADVSKGDIFDLSRVRDYYGFYRLIYTRWNESYIKNLILVGQDSTIKTRDTIDYDREITCKSKDHVITGIGVRSKSWMGTVAYIRCDYRLN